MGYAVGHLGMSYNDFCLYTLSELEEIFKAYSEKRERESQERWGMVRMHAVLTMQPHCKNRLSPEKILPFPWEKKKGKREPTGIVDKETARRNFLRRVQS